MWEFVVRYWIEFAMAGLPNIPAGVILSQSGKWRNCGDLICRGTSRLFLFGGIIEL
jgi:hypothetical protein